MNVQILNVTQEKAEKPTNETEVQERPPPPFFSVPCLTGLRGVAALGVVCSHLFGGDGAKTYLAGWEELTELGNVAVVFFFVLSAFLLTVRPLTERQKPADAKYVKWSENGIMMPWISVRWIKFVIRRAFRILPIYYVVLILAAAIPSLHSVYADLRNYEPFTFKTAFKYMVFRDVNSIFWTIPPEFEYYFIVPIFIVLYEMAERKDKLGEWTMGIQANPPGYPYGLGSAEQEMQSHYRKGLHNRVLHVYYRFGRRGLLLIALSLFNFLVAPLFWSSHGAFDYYHLPPFVRRFWMGSLTAFFYHVCAQYGYVIYDPAKPKHNQKIKGKSAKWISIIGDLICWALIVCLLLSFPYWRRLILKQYVPVTPPSWYADHMKDWPTVGSALICFLVSVTSRNGTFARCFMWIFFTFAGDVSFPLYLTHPCVIHLVVHYKIVGIDGVIFVFTLCMAISAVFHYILERPLGKIANHLCRWIQARYFTKDPKPKVRGRKKQDQEEGDMEYDGKGDDKRRLDSDPDGYRLDLSPCTRYVPQIQSPTSYNQGGPLVQVIPVSEETQELTNEPNSPKGSDTSNLLQARTATADEDDTPLANLTASPRRHSNAPSVLRNGGVHTRPASPNGQPYYYVDVGHYQFPNQATTNMRPNSSPPGGWIHQGRPY